MSDPIVLAGEQDLAGCESALPMAEWVKREQEAGRGCPPCALAAIAPWYRDVLRQEGREDLAGEVQALADGEGEPLEVAQALDGIKERVEGGLRSTLKLYDCMAQSADYEEEGT